MLNVTDLSYYYGGVQALHDVTMTFPAQQISCIMGRNGVGKTTLMNNIMGVLRPAAGSITLNERDLTTCSPNRRARNGVVLVPQGRMIFAKLTVEENLRVGLFARTDGVRTIPDFVYDTFPVLRDMRHRLGGDLSGGQQQQLAIGRCLVSEPTVMLLDEPTEGIQPNIIQQIGHVLQRLVTEMGMTIVLVEQYLDFVKEFGQQFYIMSRGQVVADGATDELTPALVHEHLSV